MVGATDRARAPHPPQHGSSPRRAAPGKVYQNAHRLGGGARRGRSPRRGRADPSAVFGRVPRDKILPGSSRRQRAGIYQHLVETHGYAGSYDSVKRYVRHLRAGCPSASWGDALRPGEEAQVDYFRGAPTFHPSRARTAVPGFLHDAVPLAHGMRKLSGAGSAHVPPLHQRAFRELTGVLTVIRHDNMTAASRARASPIRQQRSYLAFAKHWGFTPLPTQPYTPQRTASRNDRALLQAQRLPQGTALRLPEPAQPSLARWNERWLAHGSTAPPAPGLDALPGE